MPPSKLQVIETLMETGVVAVIRIDDPTDLLDVARALNEGRRQDGRDYHDRARGARHHRLSQPATG